ncbi:MAG: hypothetical protein V4621_01675 [Pseudomonadota bacterium]
MPHNPFHESLRILRQAGGGRHPHVTDFEAALSGVADVLKNVQDEDSINHLTLNLCVVINNWPLARRDELATKTWQILAPVNQNGAYMEASLTALRAMVLMKGLEKPVSGYDLVNAFKQTNAFLQELQHAVFDSMNPVKARLGYQMSHLFGLFSEGDQRIAVKHIFQALQKHDRITAETCEDNDGRIHSGDLVDVEKEILLRGQALILPRTAQDSVHVDKKTASNSVRDVACLDRYVADASDRTVQRAFAEKAAEIIAVQPTHLQPFLWTVALRHGQRNTPLFKRAKEGMNWAA